MNKAELIEILAQKTKNTKKDTEAILETMENIITETLKKGERVIFTGFGTFEVKKSKSREGVNPRNTSERIRIPEILSPKFRAGKTLKDAIRQ